jgi:cobalt-precorrin 5A hydrolase
MMPMLAIGIGCRRSCSGEAIAALVLRALEMTGSPSPARRRRCRDEVEADEPGFRSASTHPHPPVANQSSTLLRQASKIKTDAQSASFCGTFSRKREREGAPCLFTSQIKASEPGLVEAASILDMELIALPEAELIAAAPRCATRSERVEAVTGLPSLAEAAALAGAGPNSRLLLARISRDGASCAVAADPEPMP